MTETLETLNSISIDRPSSIKFAILDALKRYEKKLETGMELAATALEKHVHEIGCGVSQVLEKEEGRDPGIIIIGKDGKTRYIKVNRTTSPEVLAIKAEEERVLRFLGGDIAIKQKLKQHSDFSVTSAESVSDDPDYSINLLDMYYELLDEASTTEPLETRPYTELFEEIKKDKDFKRTFMDSMARACILNCFDIRGANLVLDTSTFKIKIVDIQTISLVNMPGDFSTAFPLNLDNLKFGQSIEPKEIGLSSQKDMTLANFVYALYFMGETDQNRIGKDATVFAEGPTHEESGRKLDTLITIAKDLKISDLAIKQSFEDAATYFMELAKKSELSPEDKEYLGYSIDRFLKLNSIAIENCKEDLITNEKAKELMEIRTSLIEHPIALATPKISTDSAMETPMPTDRLVVGTHTAAILNGKATVEPRINHAY